MNPKFIDFYTEVKNLYSLYKEAQFVLALSEEFADKKYFVGIVNELRAVLHHLMEAFQKFEENPDGDGWRKEYIKAKEEHLMRAIIDSYDAAIKYIEIEMNGSLKKYQVGDIALIFPNYNNVILPYFTELKVKLAKARTERRYDIIGAAQTELLTVIKYQEEIQRHVPLLEQHIKEQKKKEGRRTRRQIFIRVAISFLLLIIGAFLKPIIQNFLNGFKVSAQETKTNKSNNIDTPAKTNKP